MRLIWKDEFGFFLMSYPAETGENKGFRAAIIDNRDKIWWLSDDIYETTDDCGPIAKKEWEIFLEDYCSQHNHFPDGSLCIDFEPTVTVSELIKEQEEHDSKEQKEKEKSSESGKSGSN